jgi:hypothetical protein
MFWYKDIDGLSKRAFDLLYALEKAQYGYYLLGSSCGSHAVPRGDIFNIGNGAAKTIAEFVNMPEYSNYKQLVDALYNTFSNFWVLLPTSEDVYNTWKSRQPEAYSINENKELQQYISINGFAFIDDNTKYQPIYYYYNYSNKCHTIEKTSSLYTALQYGISYYYILCQICRHDRHDNIDTLLIGYVRGKGNSILSAIKSNEYLFSPFVEPDNNDIRELSAYYEFGLKNYILLPVDRKIFRECNFTNAQSFIIRKTNNADCSNYFSFIYGDIKIIKNCCEVCNLF